MENEENNETVIISTPTPPDINTVIEEAVAEVTEEAREHAKLDALESHLKQLHEKIDSIDLRITRMLEVLFAMETTVIDTENTVQDIQTEIVENTIDEQQEIEDTIAQIENDIDVDAELVEETLDTNDVIDAILPEQKKERRRLKFL